MNEKVGRNDPCTCGSGKKYKQCCFNKHQEKMTEEASPKPLSARKFTAKVIKSEPVSQNEPAKQPPKDYYTTLMERAFGQIIYTNDPPPIPEDPSIYLVKNQQE